MGRRSRTCVAATCILGLYWGYIGVIRLHRGSMALYWGVMGFCSSGEFETWRVRWSQVDGNRVVILDNEM